MLTDQDIRAKLGCRKDQRLNTDGVDVEPDRVCSCIWPIDPLAGIVVRNAETVRECVSATLAPKKRVRMCPNRVRLTAKKEVCIEFVRLGGTCIRLYIW